MWYHKELAWKATYIRWTSDSPKTSAIRHQTAKSDVFMKTDTSSSLCMRPDILAPERDIRNPLWGPRKSATHSKKVNAIYNHICIIYLCCMSPQAVIILAHAKASALYTQYYAACVCDVRKIPAGIQETIQTMVLRYIKYFWFQKTNVIGNWIISIYMHRGMLEIVEISNGITKVLS